MRQQHDHGCLGREREAAAPRKQASGGERDPERGLQSMSSIIAALNPHGRTGVCAAEGQTNVTHRHHRR
jgi:hypothetical protein